MNKDIKIFHWSADLKWGVQKYNLDKLSENISKKESFYKNNIGVTKLSEPTNDKLSIMKQRRSSGLFRKNNLMNLQQLSDILYSSASINDIPLALRPYPSAGRLFPIKINLIIKDLKNLDDGLYEYNPQSHEIIKKRKLYKQDYLKVKDIFIGQDYSVNFSVAIIMTINLYPITSKYGDRGYRYALIETGHLAQNILLAATSLFISSVPVGAFLDFDLSEFLVIDDDNELPIYTVFLGV